MKKSLKTRCLSVMTACMMLTVAAQTTVPLTGFAAENLITNSTFDSGTTDWGIYKESGGAATLSTQDGKLALNITSLGKVNYAVQMFYDIIPLYQNGVYHLHYEISASEPRYVEGMIQQNGGTYQAYTWKGLDLTTETTVVDYDFTMEYDTDIMTKLVFNCGVQEGSNPAGAHTIYLDNVTLELVDDSKVDYAAFKPYAPPIVTNQVGYRPDSKKTAVIRNAEGAKEFSVVNADTKEVVYTGTLSEGISNTSADEVDQLADFSAVTEAGTYYITSGGLDPSYTFTISDSVYDSLMDESVRMLYLQRCGTAVEDETFGHAACHNTQATIYGTSEKIDVSGGWHDAGDYGRYVVPAAKSVADLLYAYQANPDMFSDAIGIPESGNGIPDVLDEVRYELEWMLKMQAENGGVYHKVSCETFPGYVMPEAEKAPLIVTPISTTATADFCAAMALAAEFYFDVDGAFASQCMNAAIKAWDFLEENPNLIFKNPADISTGDYGDKSDKDERYWAACQLYRTATLTMDSNSLSEEMMGVLESMSVSTGLDWSTVGDYGNIALLTLPHIIDNESTVYTRAKNSILKSADSFKTITENSPYGSPIRKYDWGSNMTIANAGIILGLAYSLTEDAGYLNAASQNLDYLLGYNPLGTCFVTGYGTVAPENPHHRPSMAKNTAMPGMLVGGVNSMLEDSAAKAYCKTEPAAKCYVDNSESYSTNEITIYWNSPLTYLLTLTEGTVSNPSVPSVKGDVNADGVVNAGDATALQSYLLTKIDKLPDWKAGDMNGDGKLTAADLTELKRALM